ncbi:ABC transporter permease [Methylovirgula ligni]|uniref:ABC transporter permease n=1 Tax=Methylovirgula ligni TaxID=569860 RepID=UPI0015F2774C|nr:MlaE family lipid ABC transporter permease subunit [Methylovirgula ligni]
MPLSTTILDDRVDAAADGAWTSDEAAALEPQIETLLASRNTRALSLDLHGLSEIDTFGACLLERLTLKWREAAPVEVSGLPPRFRGLMAEVERVETIPDVPVRRRREFPVLEPIGRAIFAAFAYIATFLNMLGAVVAALLRVIANPRRMRFTSLVAQLDRVGLRAIPIILLITVLIGGIIQQQSIFQLRKFGAESYAVNLTGILVLREIGVLLVAIMVAGRSGSAYTAELGSMKMREEIDALRTMGLDPAEVLILPRLLALVIALPILGLIGGIAALFGAGLVGWIYAGISPAIFMARLHDAISVTHFEVGMYKAPFMALVIGIVSSIEGFAVKGSAESLGAQTTTSVVKSIFLVILLDGFFAMFFAWMGM